MRARTGHVSALLCAVLLCALGGCGQTGALYLPTNEGEVVSKGPDANVAPPATTPAAAATDPAAAADSEATRKRESAVPAPAPK